jgi:cell division protein FtsB
MIENKLKALLGEYTFQLCVLNHQIDELKKENEELKKEKNDKSSNS